MGAGILDGVRVVDLARGLAGSVAAMVLAEAGAEVVRVEPPGGILPVRNSAAQPPARPVAGNPVDAAGRIP